jgi:glycosyltransferase involved in cell wall biosynthesis
MRIGIDGACLANRRGFGRFSREVLAATARIDSCHEFAVFVDRPSLGKVAVPDGFATVPVEVKQAPSRAASAEGRRSVRDMLAFGRAIGRSRLDLIYFPASYSFVPVWGVGRVVLTLHDTLAIAHPELVFPGGKGRLAWKAKEHAAVAWADRVVTISEASRRDLIDWYRLPGERVHNVSCGIDPSFQPRTGPEGAEVLRKYGVDPDHRYWLYVGGLSPHKNLLRLIEAFARLGPDERLAIVGDFGDVFHTHVPELRALVDRLGLGDRVTFTGFVPDEDVAYLYTRAYALAMPSLMEGFGLPVAEAMACGIPVVASTAGALPEVVGDAGVLVDPTDVDAIALGMQRLLDDPAGRDRLSNLALRRSARFSWDAVGRSLLAVFDELGPAQSRERRKSA